MNAKNMMVAMLVALLCGCAWPQPKLSAALQKELDSPLYCKGEEQCKIMWERAAYFVNANSRFKLKVHNDIIIQTYDPPYRSGNTAFRIFKEPLGNGKYQIWTQVWCKNKIACRPRLHEIVTRAKSYIRTGNK